MNPIRRIAIQTINLASKQTDSTLKAVQNSGINLAKLKVTAKDNQDATLEARQVCGSLSRTQFHCRSVPDLFLLWQCNFVVSGPFDCDILHMVEVLATWSCSTYQAVGRSFGTILKRWRATRSFSHIYFWNVGHIEMLHHNDLVILRRSASYQMQHNCTAIVCRLVALVARLVGWTGIRYWHRAAFIVLVPGYSCWKRSCRRCLRPS